MSGERLRRWAFALAALALALFMSQLAAQLRQPFSGQWQVGEAILAVLPHSPSALGDSPAPQTPWTILFAFGAPAFLAGVGWLCAGLIIVSRQRVGPSTLLLYGALLVVACSYLLEAPHRWRDALSTAPALLERLELLRGLGLLGLVHHVALAGGMKRGALMVAPLAVLTVLLGWGPSIGVVAGLLAVAMRLRARAPRFVVRRQATWMLGGAALSLLGFALAPALPRVGPELAALGSVALAGALLAGELKLGLIEVDERLLSATLDLALMAPGVGLAVLLWSHLGEGAPRGGLLVALLLLAWLALVRLLRRPAKAALTRRIWPTAGLAELGAELRRGELEAGLASLCAAVVERLQVRGCRYLLHEGEGRLVPYGPGGVEPGVRLRLNGRLLALCAEWQAPVFVESLREAPLAVEEEALLAGLPEGTAVLVPCLAGGGLAGLLQVGAARERALDAIAYRGLAALGARLGDLVDPLWWVDRLSHEVDALGRQIGVTATLASAALGREVRMALRESQEWLTRRAWEGDEEAGERAAALERLVADLTGFDAPPRSRLFEVGPWLRDTGELLRQRAEADQVELLIEVAEGSIVADQEHLRAAVLACAKEALDRLEDWNGPRQLRLGFSTEPLALLIADSGPVRETRPVSALTDPHPQVGLPWAMAERAVAGHGGHIERVDGPHGPQTRILLPSERRG